ncbi:hypothetical protein BDZ45DRAFT_749688 [Acephala macrosclerotiorum]|nr:hypothetical protein BDZ45DRAFT_749688 [Acephala macrosclerotiorum]
MRFSIIFITMLATNPGVPFISHFPYPFTTLTKPRSTLTIPALGRRDLYSSLYCVDVTLAQNFQNNGAIVAACMAYKDRNTGTNQ